MALHSFGATKDATFDAAAAVRTTSQDVNLQVNSPTLQQNIAPTTEALTDPLLDDATLSKPLLAGTQEKVKPERRIKPPLGGAPVPEISLWLGLGTLLAMCMVAFRLRQRN